MLGNSNDQRDLSLDGIFDGLATVRRRDEDSSSIGLQLLFCFLEIW